MSVSAMPTSLRTADRVVREEWDRPPPKLIPTGLALLDEYIGGGLLPDSLAVLVAGTGRGKTGLAIQIATYQLSRGSSVLFVETELPERQVLARFMAQRLSQPWLGIFRAPSNSDIQQAADKLDRLVVHNWQPGHSLQTLLESIPCHLGKPFVVLDQLNDLARSDKSELRLATARTTGMLKSLAISMQVKILAVSQTARSNTMVPQRGMPKPRGRQYESAAKDAGEVEFDASEVFYLTSEPCHPGQFAKAEVHVAKARGGPSDLVIPLLFDAEIGIFKSEENLAGELDAVASKVLQELKAQGKPLGMSPLKRSLKMGDSRLRPVLDTLISQGSVQHNSQGYQLSAAARQP